MALLMQSLATINNFFSSYSIVLATDDFKNTNVPEFEKEVLTVSLLNVWQAATNSSQ